MATEIYLAMTAAEFAAAKQLPPKLGWMACHFSPYGTGLSNLPSSLPDGSLLILNDRIPMAGHDPDRIARQLSDAVEAMHCAGVLLDFQQPGKESLADLTARLVTALPFPVAVSDAYARELDCPVFLSPCPHHTPLQEHLETWEDREVWLDLAVDAETITLTKDGAVIRPLPLGELPEGGHREEKLHCHYRTETGDDFARFTLWRTREDLQALAKEAEALGVKKHVGLYQELKLK